MPAKPKPKPKHPGGRPTSWSKELEAEAWDYVETYADHGHAFPSVVGLCSVINRSRMCVYRWAEDEKKQFSDILEKINQQQQLVTFNKAMTGEYNASIAKLLLGKHGFHDKVDSTVAAPDGGPVKADVTWSIQPVKPVSDIEPHSGS